MPLSFDQFELARNNYCIYYRGDNKEYIILLNYILPYLEEHYKNINIFLACKKNMFYLINKHKHYIDVDEIHELRKNFSHIKELVYNMKIHPIKQFIDESNIKLKIEVSIKNKDLKTYKIIKNNNLQQLPETVIATIKGKMAAIGHTTESNDIQTSGIVVGLPSEELALAAVNGVRFSVVYDDAANEFYNIFPNAITLQ